MKKTRSAIVTLGILATTLAIEGQTVGGSASGTPAGSANPGARAANAPAVRAGNARVAAPAQPPVAGGLNTSGSASIVQPAATPPVGGATVIGEPANTFGGSSSGNTTLASPGGGGTLGATATLPGNGPVVNPVTVPIGTLPAPVQTVLRPFGANGQL